MNREAIGSFLFIVGLDGRCSPVGGGFTFGRGLIGRAGGGEAANFEVAGADADGVGGRPDGSGGAGRIDGRL
jgi:hypothetical protein